MICSSLNLLFRIWVSVVRDSQFKCGTNRVSGQHQLHSPILHELKIWESFWNFRLREGNNLIYIKQGSENGDP